MAAAEYYFGSSNAMNQTRPNPLPPQQSQHPHSLQQPPNSNQQLQQFAPQPPSCSAYASSPQPQAYPAQQPHQQYPSQLPGPPPNFNPPASAPYQQMGPQKYSQPHVQQNGYIGAPLQPHRSHSQPARVHFADDKDSDFSDYSTSDSDASRQRRHRHKHRSHSSRHHRSRSSSSDRDLAYGSTRDYDDVREEGNRHGKPRVEHKSRDTFLGAGGGALVGDMIFPGLGTVGGLLIGGYGGRKHSKKRSSSHAGDVGGSGRRGRRRSGDGWDEESMTFKKGHAVR